MLFDAGLIVLDRDRVKGEEGGSWNDGPLTYDTACRSSNLSLDACSRRIG